MLKTIHSKITKQPEYVSLFAVFVRHASAREKKKVFEQVMKDATEKQRNLMESARKESKYLERKETQPEHSYTKKPGSANNLS